MKYHGKIKVNGIIVINRFSIKAESIQEAMNLIIQFAEIDAEKLEVEIEKQKD